VPIKNNNVITCIKYSMHDPMCDVNPFVLGAKQMYII